MMNSPGSRALTTIGQAADPRKSWGDFLFNFAGPGRITDVDMARARSVQGRRLLEEQLRTDPNVRRFENFYIRPEDAAQADPQTIQLLRLYRTLLDQAKAARQQNPQLGTPPAATSGVNFRL
jgi:hypothetical protein